MRREIRGESIYGEKSGRYRKRTGQTRRLGRLVGVPCGRENSSAVLRSCISCFHGGNRCESIGTCVSSWFRIRILTHSHVWLSSSLCSFAHDRPLSSQTGTIRLRHT